MSDLGSWPSLADVLLTGPADAAASALLSWARACGNLAVGTAGRQDELARLTAAHRIAPMAASQDDWLQRRLEEIPALLAGLDIPAPPGLTADLPEVESILRAGQYEVFSPGDICPDNNLMTGDGIRFIDYESAEFHSGLLEAAYFTMPFSTCWCVFRLPDQFARSAEAAYRDLVSAIHPDLASDPIWRPGLRRAMAAWTLHAMTYLLDRSLIADRPKGRADRAPALAVPLEAAARRARAHRRAQLDLRAHAGPARQDRGLAGPWPAPLSRLSLRSASTANGSAGARWLAPNGWPAGLTAAIR